MRSSCTNTRAVPGEAPWMLAGFDLLLGRVNFGRGLAE